MSRAEQLAALHAGSVGPLLAAQSKVNDQFYLDIEVIPARASADQSFVLEARNAVIRKSGDEHPITARRRAGL
jgi:hypothetical protein